MLRNHFSIAIRHLCRHKFYSSINVIGLGVSFASAYLIVLYLGHELSFDQFYKNKNDLYRMTTERVAGNAVESSAEAYFGAGNLASENFEEVNEVTRCYRWPANTGLLFRINDRIFNERDYLFAEQTFFKVFGGLLISGDPASCLSDPSSVVITARLALKMFGTVDVLGRTLSYLDRSTHHVVITGIMRDVPTNSHFDLDVVRPFESEWLPDPSNYWNGRWWTYLSINEGTDIHQFEARLNASLEKVNSDNTDYKGTLSRIQKVTDIHLNSHLASEIKSNGSWQLVIIVAAALCVILAAAWFNYVNLETARFLHRVKEVSVRRIIGSSRWSLVTQFLVQYFCINLIAMALAVLIILLVTPPYLRMSGLESASIAGQAIWPWIAAIAFVVGGALLIGIYPALLLAKTNVVTALKGRVGTSLKFPALRRSLLGFQFVACMSLIALLMVVGNQLEFMRNAKLNVNLQRVLGVYNPTNYSGYEDSLRQERNELFRNTVLTQGAITNMTTSSAIPGEPVGFTYVDLAKRSLTDPDKQIPYKVVYIDYDFLPVYGLKLLAGRNYELSSGEDRNRGSLVVTESTIRYLGFKSVEEAIDKEIYFMEMDWDKWKIIGVVEDYRHESMKAPINPTIFRLHRNKGQMVYYSFAIIDGSTSDDAVEAVSRAWSATWPEKPFDYFFLDEFYDSQYRHEVLFSRIFTMFAFVALLIACLGILGMALAEANARLREISIRKVLGATPSAVLWLLTSKTFRLLMVAMVVSGPVISLTASEWLSMYPVRIDFSWTFLVVPFVVLTIFVAAIASIQTLRVSGGSPVEHLKSE